MTPTVVNNDPQPGANGAPAAPPAAPGQAPAQAGPDAAALQARIDELTAQNEENRRAAEFWHTKATERPAEPAPPKEPETEADVLELAAKGGKAFEKYLDGWAKKNGYVKGEEMTNAINERAAQLNAENALIERYPALKDNNSELFKTTAQFYGELKKDGVSERVAMSIAAERAELKLIREGKMKTPHEEKTERERQRLERVRAQGGERSTRSTAEPDETDTELTAEQRRIAHSMLIGEIGTDGKPMDAAAAEAAYKARASKGVQRFGGKQ